MPASEISLLKAGSAKLLELSRKTLLSLNLEEMKAVQKYFRKIKREPRDVELEMIAQTWSEHCKHKTITSRVEYRYRGKDGRIRKKRFGNLLKETVFRVTRELNRKWCVSVFRDNAGIISFDQKRGIAFKVETHNHPSALEPYGGAGTGIGGVIRDILGVGLGAKPIMNTDVFCFGPLDHPYEKIPEGVLHPKRVFNGVVSGVRDYGNRMGIPTAGGGILFDESYIYNPLVFCGTIGILPLKMAFKKIDPGDLILAVGGRTGRDGIHGATFSSLSLDRDTGTGAVQIGNPIVEKKVLDTLLAARDRKLYNAVTDCGAGGFSSAVGELALFSNGARVHLEKAPLKYKGLEAWEIWLSESQERMVLAVPPRKLDEILKVFSDEDVEATVLGEFTDTGRLEVFYNKEIICDLEMDFLHEGLPKSGRKASCLSPAKKKDPGELLGIRDPSSPESLLLSKLGDLNTASKEWVVRQYDFEVQARTVVKPFAGAAYDGPSDAAVLKIDPDSPRGIVAACGINLYGKYDAYAMASSAIDESLRNIVCSGGDPDRTALLDNFCWGALDTPSEFAGLVRACQACYDVARIYRTPFISGKDSLNNKYVLENGRVISITPALLVSAVSVIEDVRKCVTMDLKKEGSPFYIVGRTSDSFPPSLDPKVSYRQMRALHKAIRRGLVLSCHDCSEGGLAVALSEMSFSGGLGLSVDLACLPHDIRGRTERLDKLLLFSESNSRFLVEVKPSREKEFVRMMKGVSFSLIGRVLADKKLKIKGVRNSPLLDADIMKLKQVWQNALPEKL